MMDAPAVIEYEGIAYRQSPLVDAPWTASLVVPAEDSSPGLPSPGAQRATCLAFNGPRRRQELMRLRILSHFRTTSLRRPSLLASTLLTTEANSNLLSRLTTSTGVQACDAAS